MTDSSTIRDFR